MTELRASVRQVVEFSLHERDLSPAAFAAKRMREGAAAHKARQSAGAREETAYQAEKSLSADYAARGCCSPRTARASWRKSSWARRKTRSSRRIGRRRRCTGTCSAKRRA